MTAALNALGRLKLQMTNFNVKTPNDQFKCECGQIFEQEGKKIYIFLCL